MILTAKFAAFLEAFMKFGCPRALPSKRLDRVERMPSPPWTSRPRRSHSPMREPSQLFMVRKWHLMVILVVLGFPRGFLFPRSQGLDHSWMTSLNLAERDGLVFGKDLIFPYGPLAFACLSQGRRFYQDPWSEATTHPACRIRFVLLDGLALPVEDRSTWLGFSFRVAVAARRDGHDRRNSHEYDRRLSRPELRRAETPAGDDGRITGGVEPLHQSSTSPWAAC